MEHLLGQETRQARSRGMACRANELSMRTYLRMMLKSNASKTDAVWTKHVPSNFARISFSKHAARNALIKRGVTNRVREARRRLTRTRLRPTQTSAFSMYRKVHWGPGISPFTAAGKAETQRLILEFKRQSD
eukprot:7095554-Pyramimonas_sp.AAC.1